MDSSLNDSIILCNNCNSYFLSCSFTKRNKDLYIKTQCNKCNFCKHIPLEEFITINKLINLSKNLHYCGYDQTHSSISAKIYCHDCNQWLCTTCIKNHSSLNHLLTPSHSYTNLLSCSNSSSHKINLYCKTCKFTYCKECVDSYHFNHSVIDYISLSETIDTINPEAFFKSIDAIILTNQRNKEKILNDVLMEIKELNNIKNRIELSYEHNVKTNMMIKQVLLMMNNNYNISKQLNCFESLLNIQNNFIANEVKLDISKYGNDINNNRKEAIKYFFTQFIISLENNIQCVSTINSDYVAKEIMIQLQDKRLVIPSYNNSIIILSYPVFKRDLILKGHTSNIFCLTQLQNTNLVSGSSDYKIKVWEITNGQCLITLHNHTNSIYSIIQLKDDSCLLSASSDHTVILWDIKTWTCIKIVNFDQTSVYSLLQLDDKRIACGCSDNKIRLYDSSMENSHNILEGHIMHITILIQLKDGRLVSGSSDETIIIWDLEQFRIVEKLDNSNHLVLTLLETNYGTLLCGSDDYICEWDLNSMCLFRLFKANEMIINWFVQISDGIIAVCGEDHIIKLWAIK